MFERHYQQRHFEGTFPLYKSVECVSRRPAVHHLEYVSALTYTQYLNHTCEILP
jgi:hypothetical protein